MMAPIIISTGIRVAFAQETKQESEMMNNMSTNSDGNSHLITSITEWTGIAALAMTVGVILAGGINIIPRNNTDSRKSYSSMRTKVSIFTLIGMLSIAVGLIHILLVNEHMTESYIWGIAFLAMGIPQLGYGILMIFAERLGTTTRKVLYEIGIAGNMLLVFVLISVRLFVPPFSPEETPVRELELNGVLTVVIELFIVALLTYLVKERKQEDITQVMRTKKITRLFYSK